MLNLNQLFEMLAYQSKTACIKLNFSFFFVLVLKKYNPLSRRGEVGKSYDPQPGSSRPIVLQVLNVSLQQHI